MTAWYCTVQSSIADVDRSKIPPPRIICCPLGVALISANMRGRRDSKGGFSPHVCCLWNDCCGVCGTSGVVYVPLPCPLSGLVVLCVCGSACVPLTRWDSQCPVSIQLDGASDHIPVCGSLPLSFIWPWTRRNLGVLHLYVWF